MEDEVNMYKKNMYSDSGADSGAQAHPTKAHMALVELMEKGLLKHVISQNTVLSHQLIPDHHKNNS